MENQGRFYQNPLSGYEVDMKKKKNNHMTLTFDLDPADPSLALVISCLPMKLGKCRLKGFQVIELEWTPAHR